WADVTFGEVQMLEELASQPSLRAWAQLKTLSPMSAGRNIKQLESKLGRSLVIRTTQGIRLTQEGEKLALMARKMGPIISDLDQAINLGKSSAFDKNIVIGSRGFLNISLAGSIAKYFENRETNLDFVDASPSEMLEATKKDALDIAISLDSTSFGKGWIERSVGSLTWAVYGNPCHPLAQGANPEGIERYRLGHQCFWNGRIIESNLRAPHATLEGIAQLGHGAQSAMTAIQIASTTEQLVCVPRMVGHPACASGLVVEIPVIKGQLPTSGIFISAHLDRVKKSVFNDLIQLIREQIDRVQSS
ncbi:MAG: LysR family transcriptional regulator, partial [Proteobacteria bacterium]|nr:LysR family transcriptional regulator [Pseudomonadota bacterium]